MWTSGACWNGRRDIPAWMREPVRAPGGVIQSRSDRSSGDVARRHCVLMTEMRLS